MTLIAAVGNIGALASFLALVGFVPALKTYFPASGSDGLPFRTSAFLPLRGFLVQANSTDFHPYSHLAQFALCGDVVNGNFTGLRAITTKGINMVAHFNIEKSRKIQISIPGYDPLDQVKKLQQRLKKVRAKNRQAQKAKTKEAAAPVQPPTKQFVGSPESDVDALNQLLALPSVGLSDVNGAEGKSTVEEKTAPNAQVKGSQ